mgnify:CR=1 FL=1
MRTSLDDLSLVLGELALFRDLPDTVIAEVARAAHVVSLPKGAAIYASGERPKALFHVMSGHLKVAVSSPEGGEKVIEILSPNQLFGVAELFGDAGSDLLLADAAVVDQHAAELVAGGARRVDSGSEPGRFHLYLPLSEPVPAAEAEVLNRRLAVRLARKRRHVFAPLWLALMVVLSSPWRWARSGRTRSATRASSCARDQAVPCGRKRCAGGSTASASSWLPIRQSKLSVLRRAPLQLGHSV